MTAPGTPGGSMPLTESLRGLADRIHIERSLSEPLLEKYGERLNLLTPIFMLGTAAFGTGVLTLPYAVVEGGLLFVVPAFFFAALQSALSNLYLVKIGRARGAASYGDLIETVVEEVEAEEGTGGGGGGRGNSIY